MSNNKITSIPKIKKYYLYGLYCPFSDNLRYIGITTGLLSNRLSGHLRNPTNGKIALWFKSLKEQGERPKIKLIKEYNTYEDLLYAEIIAIKENRKKITNLLNIADGGDINPMFGKNHTDEARLKISKTHKGRKLSAEQIKEKKNMLTKLWCDEEWSKKLRKKNVR